MMTDMMIFIYMQRKQELVKNNKVPEDKAIYRFFLFVLFYFIFLSFHRYVKIILAIYGFERYFLSIFIEGK